MRLAIDAMGGDYAPREIVPGALEGLSFLGPSDEVVIIGREDAIRPLLPASGLDPRARLEVKALLKELRRMGKTTLISSRSQSHTGAGFAAVSLSTIRVCAPEL